MRRELLPEEPYRSYGITLDEFFERGGPREFEDVVGITDRLWGWDSDYAHMRAVGLEAVEAHPLRYLFGVGKTTFEELWKPLFVALPNDEVEATRDTSRTAPSRQRSRASGPFGWGADSRRPPRILLDDSGRAHPRDLDVPVDHSLVFATQAMQRRYDEIGRDAAALMAEVPPYGGNEWLTLQFSRSSKLFPPPILWLVAGLVGLVVLRPKRLGLALVLAGAAVLVVGFQALAIYTIVEFAIPVAPALIVLGAAGLVGTRRVAPGLTPRKAS